MTLPLRCACGQVQGTVDASRRYARATCYCRDCQAYARFLGRNGLMDAQGGSDIVAMDPAGVKIDAGMDHVACVSLSGKGLLRWYASCCRTPLGNTPRDGKTAYVGMLTTSMLASDAGAGIALDEAFGPQGRVVLNAGSARGKVKATPVAFLVDGLKIMRGLIGARLRGQPPTLFFDAQGRPLLEPEVLGGPQRAALGANEA